MISSDIVYYDTNWIGDDVSVSGTGENSEEDITSVVLPSPLNTGLSIVSPLSSRELYYLDFFLNKGSTICSIGLPTIVKMWQTDGFQVALQSNLVLNAVCAFSSNVLEKGPQVSSLFPTKADIPVPVSSSRSMVKSPRRLYLHNAITLLRDQIARDKRTHNPIELVLASYLISACSLAEFDLIPVLSRNGGADIMGITQGNDELFRAYYKEVSGSFTRALILQDYHHLFAQTQNNNSTRAASKFEFIAHLKQKLASFNGNGVIDHDESLIYLDTINHIDELFSFALALNNMYPVIVSFYGLANAYRRKARQGRPFALIILAFLCAVFRRTILIARPKPDTWDRCLEDITSQLPLLYRPLGNDAIQMRQGSKFNRDITKLTYVSVL